MTPAPCDLPAPGRGDWEPALRRIGLALVETLQLLPAVDVQDGQAVQLVQGVAGTQKEFGDPLAAALRWQGTVTGRANADGGIHKHQFHNTPKRANARNSLRLTMESVPGWWYAADSGQIEVRVNAVLSGEEALLRTTRWGIEKRGQQLRNVGTWLRDEFEGFNSRAQ